MSRMEIVAPEGVEINLKLYLVSQTNGVETVVTLGGMKKLQPFEGVRDPNEIIKHFELPGIGDDWRLMTRAEIEDFKERQEED